MTIHRPELEIREGGVLQLPERLARDGHRSVAIVTGGRSVRGRDEWGALLDRLLDAGVTFAEATVRGEPSPDDVARIVDEVRETAPGATAVVGIGGGSAIDAAKAAAAMVAQEPGGDDVTIWLEGVGTRRPDGRTLPLYAVPTTAGTGTEATTNAVISRVGRDGFKKSLRHAAFMPRYALIDASLHTGCPDDVTRAAGLDALTQLIEAYLSPAASPVVAGMVYGAFAPTLNALERVLAGADTPELRATVAYGAHVSGVALAHAGLGVVHGIASPIGALRAIPHGVVCGALIAPSLRVTRRRSDERAEALLHRLATSCDASAGADDLVARIAALAEPLGSLRGWGLAPEDDRVILSGTALKNHPVALSPDEVAEILAEATR